MLQLFERLMLLERIVDRLKSRILGRHIFDLHPVRARLVGERRCFHAEYREKKSTDRTKNRLSVLDTTAWITTPK